MAREDFLGSSVWFCSRGVIPLWCIFKTPFLKTLLLFEAFGERFVFISNMTSQRMAMKAGASLILGYAGFFLISYFPGDFNLSNQDSFSVDGDFTNPTDFNFIS